MPLRTAREAAILLVAAAFTGIGCIAEARTHDLVITGGRVMDPESGFDTIANVGIADGIIVEISEHALHGARTIDARGLVVAPGFIDLHAHAQNLDGQRLQVLDGVTTALEQENGVYPVQSFYAAREQRSRINFGASVGHQGIRIKLKTGIEMGHAGTNLDRADRVLRMKHRWAEEALSDEELNRAVGLFREGLGAGGLGLGLSTEYVPGADRREVYALMQAAASEGVPVFTHVRAANHSGPGGLLEMMQEVIANTAASGGKLHVCHVTSKGLNDTALILDAIAGAHAHGMDVTTEVYPYTAGSTLLGSALFNEGWQQRWGASFEDIEWPATGERLTAESFERLRRQQPATYVVFHMIPETAMNMAIQHPLAMIASDGVSLIDGHGHPRGAGTYARVLGVHVREKGHITLMEALRKMSLMPAQRMDFVPAMRRKGRLQPGMDADITLFDPDTVVDRATYRSPSEPSFGIVHVLVNGQLVVRDGQLLEQSLPGRPIRRDVTGVP